MTDEAVHPAGDLAQHETLAGSESTEAARRSGRPWGWVAAGLITLLMLYPLARWMMRGGGPPPGATQLQLSFDDYSAGRYAEAVEDAKAALLANPNLADAYNNMAAAYAQLHQYDEGIRAAEQAVRLNPNHQLAKNNLAWLQQEKAKAALPPLSAAQAAQVSALINQSMAHFRAGRFRECMEAAAAAAKLDPNSPLAFNNIGICACNLQLWDVAIRNTQEAIRLDPSFQMAKNNLSWIKQEMRKAAEKKVP